MELLEAEAADGTAMLAAEELHQLVVVRADALGQVADRLTQLVDSKSWVFPVRPQVLLAERGHAGEAGLRRFCFHTCITAYDILALGLAVLCCPQVGLALGRPQVEGLHDGAEDRVFLQLRFGGEVGPTLRTAVRVLPAGEEAVLAEVVSAGDGHRAVKGTQTDAAAQLFLQTQQRKRTLVHRRHHETPVGWALSCEGETKLNFSISGKPSGLIEFFPHQHDVLSGISTVCLCKHFQGALPTTDSST